MYNVLRILFLLLFSYISWAVNSFYYFPYNSNLVVRQAYLNKSYKFWLKLDVTNNINHNCEFNNYDRLQEVITNFSFSPRVDVIYLSGIDIFNCDKDKLIEMIKYLSQRNYFVAIQLDNNIKNEDLIDSNNLKEEFVGKYNNLKNSDIDLWVDYIIFKNPLNLLTYSERKFILDELRNIFPRSFLGFEFVVDITKDHNDNYHPLRNIHWNEILPQEYDGDFIILPFYYDANLKFTEVISDDTWTAGSSGQIYTLPL